MIADTIPSDPAPVPPTVAEALTAVASWEELPHSRRRVLVTGLHTLARLEGKPPEAVRLDPVAAIARMEATSPAALGVAASTFANYRAGVRYVMRRLGLLASQRPRTRPASDPAWTALLQTLPSGPGFNRLRTFVSYCSAEGILPTEVQQAILDRYAEMRAATRGGTKSQDHARRVVNQWNQAIRECPGWPPTRLGLREQALNRSPPFDAYPESLQREITAYLDTIGQTQAAGLFSGPARRPVKPSTVTSRNYCLRRLLHGAVQNGIPMDRLAELRSVVDPAFIRAALDWHYHRSGNQLTSDLGQMAATIASVAQYLNLPQTNPTLWAEIKHILARVKPPQREEITEHNARLLDALGDPVTRAKLLHLPARLIQEAARLRDGWTDRKGLAHMPRPTEAGYLAGIAVVIEVLLHAPMRRDNLLHLRIGHELRLAAIGRGKWRGTICIAGEAVKNRRRIEFPLEADSIALIRDYLDDFRPALPNADTEWLFPGQAGRDRPRNKTSFGTAISQTIHEHVGVRVNPHAFRAFAGALILEANPHAIDDVRAVLGHSSFATAMVYYRRNSQKEAAGRLSDMLACHRRATRLLAGARSPQLGGRPAWRRTRGNG